ncbi:MAG: hypothetical protein K9I29_09315 [Bacteroidales bacterium]|nr:hypothetical protein [Bacteroidales bacterium]MCF8328476.1 hypothetical protein [Bacteroidales bacterium]
MKHILYLILVVFLFTGFSGSNLFSQSYTDSVSYRSVTRLNISLQANSYNDLNINNTVGKELLNSGQTITPELGVSLSQDIWKNWGVSFGGAATVIPLNTNFNFDLKKYSPYFEESLSTYFSDYWYFIADYMLNFGAFKTFYWKNDYSFNIEAGVKLNRIWPYGITSGLSVVNNADETKRIFDFRIESPTSDWMTKYSYYGKFGLLKHTRRNLNHWTLSLVYQYSPAIIGKGHYEFSNLHEPNEGEVELGLNYLGVEFLYAFNLLKKTDLSPDKGFSRTHYELNKENNPEFRLNAAEFDTLPFNSLYLKGGLGLNRYNKLDMDKNDILRSKNTYSPSFALDIAYSLKNNWVINSGVEFKQLPTKVYFYETIGQVNDINKDNIYSIPVAIQKLFYKKKLWFWNLYGGLMYSRIKELWFGGGSDEFSYKVGNESLWKNTFGIFLKGGLFKKMKNERFMEFNFVAHYSPFDVKEGYFETKNQKGDITLGLNYIGLELVYGFQLWDF